MAAGSMVVEKRASAHESAFRELAVAGALASAAILAAFGHTAFAGGLAVVGFAALFAEDPGIRREKEAKALPFARAPVNQPRFMP